MIGTCPHCNMQIGTLKVNAVDARSLTSTWAAATFTCPQCNKILGTGFDQTAHSKWVVDEVMRRLRSGG